MTNLIQTKPSEKLETYDFSPLFADAIRSTQEASRRIDEVFQPLIDAQRRRQELMRPFQSRMDKVWAKQKRAAARFERAFKKIDFPKFEIKIPEKTLQEWEWMMERYRAAEADPENEKSKLWLALAHLGPADIRDFRHLLPDPRVKRAKRGRPKRSGCYASDETLMPDMDRLVGEGMPWKTAARILLQERGYKTGITDKSGYVATLYKKYLTSG